MERQPAYAIGRTPGSLVVICGEQAGQYEYLGVRLSDAAVLRTNAQTDSARSFLAQKAGVLYAVSPTELKVTAGTHGDQTRTDDRIPRGAALGTVS